MSKTKEFIKNSKMIKENRNKCELCGDCIGPFEVHHIIPYSVCKSDDFDNLILLCKRCHDRLTPRSLLTRMGKDRARQTKDLYINLAEAYDIVESRGGCDAIELCDILESVSSCYMTNEDRELMAAINGDKVCKGTVGRPAAEATEDFLKAVKEWRDGKITATEAIKQSGYKRTTFYKLVKKNGL